MKKTKNNLLIWLYLTISIVSWVYYYFIFFNQVLANPDYICRKNVAEECRVTSCWPWNENWQRTCDWIRVTQRSYYLIRTECEPWYSKYSNGWNVWWSSWRNSWDWASATQSCTIVQIDTTPPVWDATWE